MWSMPVSEASLSRRERHIKGARIYGSDTSLVIAAVAVERVFDRQLPVL